MKNGRPVLGLMVSEGTAIPPIPCTSEAETDSSIAIVANGNDETVKVNNQTTSEKVQTDKMQIQEVVENDLTTDESEQTVEESMVVDNEEDEVIDDVRTNWEDSLVLSS